MAALDRDADTVLALIEDGTLPWAFNLSTEIYFRRNVRILAQCIADFQKGKPASNLDFPDGVLAARRRGKTQSLCHRTTPQRRSEPCR
jgi:hypothetical protein